MKLFITAFIVLAFTKTTVFVNPGKTLAERVNQQIVMRYGNDNPIKIKFLHQKRGKPPLTFNNIMLSISNQFDSLRPASFENMLIEGTGGIEIIVKPQGKEFKIIMNHIQGDVLGVLSDGWDLM
ncbi:MAG: hypothetical protein V4506_03005, partial [Bacteroidota bacterium]